MRASVLAFASIALVIAQPALATGDFSCSFTDRNSRFEAGASFSHGVGEGFVSFGAKLEVLAKGVPEDLRKLELGLEQLTQRWLYGRQLKLRLYHERTGSAPHGYVELVLQTRRGGKDDTGYHRGGYVLTVYDLPPGAKVGKTLTLRGRASCSGG